MKRNHTFRFVDDNLNSKLIALLDRKAKGKFSVSDEGLVRYMHVDEDLIGNELICAVRTTVFDSWQIISCPSRSVEYYKRYMYEHKIPFNEEIRDNQLRFLIPRNYRPHNWKLEEAIVSSLR